VPDPPERFDAKRILRALVPLRLALCALPILLLVACPGSAIASAVSAGGGGGGGGGSGGGGGFGLLRHIITSP
tara:strand:- start:27771 stop:27989 length:219 start_codon:yes stop_codon:yes gene_type:complete